jgi:hypothetical protein
MVGVTLVIISLTVGVERERVIERERERERERVQKIFSLILKFTLAMLHIQ